MTGKIITATPYDAAQFTDSWHKNDTLWRIRELPVDALYDAMEQLPAPDTCKFDLVKVELVHPGKGTYIWIFNRRRLESGPPAWFIHQVEFHAH